MGVIWAAVLVMSLGVVQMAPTVKFDQRQEGDVNVRADLENFVILIIPTSGSSNLNLLELLTKSLPSKNNLKNKRGEIKKPVISGEEETQHFIESKTAPYHVDISRTRAHLAKLHPQVKLQENSEVLIAHSPVVALSKNQQQSRSARNIIINQDDDLKALILTSDIGVDVKKNDNAIDKPEKIDRKDDSEELTLLGAELVQCGPDQKRDAQGICQIVKP